MESYGYFALVLGRICAAGFGGYNIRISSMIIVDGMAYKASPTKYHINSFA
jgi:hypothetical protein